MHKCEPPPLPPKPPPVPPRRKKRQIVKNVETPKEVEKTNRIKRVDRKRLPPPPPPSQLPRRNKTRFVQENQIQTRIVVHASSLKDQKDESNEIVRSADSKNANLNSSELGDTNLKSEELTVDKKVEECFVRSPGNDEITKEERSADSINVNTANLCLEDTNKRANDLMVDENSDGLFVYSPRYEKPPRNEGFNKYPSLFFTLDDIQDIIPDDIPSDEKEEDLKVDEEETDNSLEKDQSELKEEIKESFIDNRIEIEADVCFRVTPTNFPFEKCLNRWKTSLEGDDFGIDERNNFIFEDYMDRSNVVNVRRSKSSMCYDVFDSDDTTVEHTATKVRFVIESPSSSTPDIDLQDSLQNVDSITNEEVNEEDDHVEIDSKNDDRASTDADAFGEIPFGSVIESNINPVEFHETCSNSTVKAVENKEGEVRANFPDSSAPPTIEDHFPKEQIPSKAEVECSNQIQEISAEHEVSETVDRVNENLVFSENLNESSNTRKQLDISERRKIFVTQSLRSFMNDSPVDWNDNESQKDEAMDKEYYYKSEINEEKYKDSNGTNTREVEVASNLGSGGSRLDVSIEEVSTLTGKEAEVPVSVRRNSFLEQMLSDDGSDKAWNLGCCEIVAAHPKSDGLTSLTEERDEKRSNHDYSSPKNVVDVKTDVLNELLSNFATIKLKSVNKIDKIATCPKDDEIIKGTVNRVDDKDTGRITANEMAVLRIQAEINVSERLNEDMKNSKTLENDSTDTEHSDNRVEVAEGIRTSSIIDESKNTNPNDVVAISENLSNESMEHEGKTDSAVKCAIVREKTPNVITPLNNDDNNRAVRTPVALSNDQSSGQEASTIIPGSVRSFVKYYEIRRETTAVEDSKINDRRTLDQRSNLVRSNVEQASVSNRIKRFEYEERIRAARDDTESQITSKNGRRELPINPESVSNEISYTMIVKKVIEPRGFKMECTKESSESQNDVDGCCESSFCESSIKNGRKKSVKFGGEHTVIRSHEADLKNAEEDLEDGFSQPRQHLAQEMPRTDYESDSGINRFVSNATSNARLVFYCTV